MKRIKRKIVNTDLIKINLKKYRNQAQLSQVELSKLAGVSKTTVSAIEAGIIKNPSFISILNISKALNIEIEDLIEDNQRSHNEYE